MKLQPITVFPAWQQIERHALEMQRWLETQSGREIDARYKALSTEELEAELARQKQERLP